LQPGDIVISVDGQAAENLPTVNYNFRLRESQDPVQLVIQRGSTQAKFSVAAVEQKSEFDSVASLADPQKNLVPELGILGVEIDPRIVDATSGLRDPYGIIVAARAAGPASEVPLLPRDVIRSMNDTKMYTLEQLRTALRALKPGSAITLQIQREGRLQYLSFTLD
jgi:S1-C subfamily serine protease